MATIWLLSIRRAYDVLDIVVHRLRVYYWNHERRVDKRLPPVTMMTI